MAANVGMFFETANEIRGGKYVWFKESSPSGRKGVSLGCTIANPFTGLGKAFAGDLFEYRMNNTGYLFKTFSIKANAIASATSIVINGDGYSTLPEVGNKVIKSGDLATTIGLVGTITAVVYNPNDETFTCTLDKAIGALSIGDVLVEATALDAATADIVVTKVAATAPSTAATGDTYLNTADGKIYTATATNTWGETGVSLANGKYVFNSADSKNYTLVSSTVTEVTAGTPLVKNPNTFIETDIEFLPSVGFGLTNVNHSISTIWDKIAIQCKMQPLPKYVLAKNRSYIEGLFWI